MQGRAQRLSPGTAYGVRLADSTPGIPVLTPFCRRQRSAHRRTDCATRCREARRRNSRSAMQFRIQLHSHYAGRPGNRQRYTGKEFGLFPVQHTPVFIRSSRIIGRTCRRLNGAGNQASNTSSIIRTSGRLPVRTGGPHVPAPQDTYI